MITKSKPNYVIVIDADRCKACGLCITFCPANVLALGEQLNRYGYHPVVAVKPDDCTGCRSCVIMCPDVCIEIYRADGAESAGAAKGMSGNGEACAAT
ncbi:MAG: 4Fe-4S dicluster domain-containing protein [Armatimonadetes bacterium]|nr:4Fe-4S dicluster domain-containing protein [Armatimonadota bacterium]